MKKLGILGGTFNPIHVGHLLIAEQAREAYALDKILFMPTYAPPHKEFGHQVRTTHRLGCIELAIEGHPHFEMNTYEIDHKGVSYTIETVEHLRIAYPGRTLYWIIGTDLYQSIRTWKAIEKLCALIEFIVFERNEVPFEDCVYPGYGTFHFLKSPIKYTLNSTTIREKLKNRQSIRYMVHERVFDYIHEHQLWY